MPTALSNKRQLHRFSFFHSVLFKIITSPINYYHSATVTSCPKSSLFISHLSISEFSGNPMYLRTTWNGMTNASRSCFPTFLVNQEPEAARASPSEHCPAQGLLLFYCISSIQSRFPRIQPHPAPAPLESCENRREASFSFPSLPPPRLPLFHPGLSHPGRLSYTPTTASRPALLRLAPCQPFSAPSAAALGWISR